MYQHCLSEGPEALRKLMEIQRRKDEDKDGEEERTGWRVWCGLFRGDSDIMKD